MDFEDIVSMLPVGWEKVLGQGMGFFINQQEPEWVEFEKVANGYVIKVATDEESSQDAREFWEEFVDDKL